VQIAETFKLIRDILT